MDTTAVAKVAAGWWATLLRQDREKFGNVRASIVYQELFGDLPDLTDEALATFETCLAGAIEKVLDVAVTQSPFCWVNVCTDYEPNRLVWAAAEAAQIDLDRFPGKTKLIIESDLVRVSRGYGAKWETIYQIEQ